MFKNSLTVSIFSIILIAVIAFGFVFFLDKCGKPVEPNTHAADSIKIAADSIYTIQQKKIDSLTKDDIVWQAKYYDTWNKLNVSISVISKKSDSIKKISVAYNNAKKESDTLAELVTCNELNDQIQDLLTQLDSASTIIDSLKNTSDSTLSNKDVTIDLLVAQVNDLKSSLDAYQTQFALLLKQDKKNIAKLNFDSIISKVATVAAALLTVFVVLKK